MNKKLYYTAPEAVDLELRFEASFLNTITGEGSNVDDGEEDENWGEF